MAEGKRLHPQVSQVEEIVKRIHVDKKPRLREFLIQKAEILKKIQAAEELKQQQIAKPLVRKRLKRFRKILIGKNTVRYQDDLHNSKPMICLSNGVSIRRSFRG